MCLSHNFKQEGFDIPWLGRQEIIGSEQGVWYSIGRVSKTDLRVDHYIIVNEIYTMDRGFNIP